MTTDFRALCAELTEFVARLTKHYYEPAELLTRARAALANEPAVPEGREPVAVTKQPSDEELLGLTEDWPATTGPRHDLSGCPEVPLYSVFADEVVDFARAVLARWGTPNLVEVRSSLGDGEAVEPEPKRPTVMEIIELADEIEAAGLGQVDLVRAALARWGTSSLAE